MNRHSILPKGFAGHLLDVWRIITFRFSHPHSYTKFRQIKRVRNLVNADTLIETGTYLGVTTKRCARVFKKVYTIELDEHLYAQSSLRLKKYKNVFCVLGDASKELERILCCCSENSTLIFLDGHFSGGKTAMGDVIEPALSELEIIARYKENVSGVVIDDFREFGKPGWPRKSELLLYAEKFFPSPEYKIYVHLDQLVIHRAFFES